MDLLTTSINYRPKNYFSSESISINACLLIIDEMSMIDATLLSHVNSRFKDITRSKEEFGGIPSILMGDMYQLPFSW
jgi:hypothetical protein